MSWNGNVAALIIECFYIINSVLPCVKFHLILTNNDEAIKSQAKAYLNIHLIKVVVLACYGACFVVHVFRYLAPNFVSGRPA